MGKSKVPARTKKTTQEKKPWLTKKQWIEFAATVVGIVVLVWLIFVLVDKFDGSLPVENNLPVVEGDNWILTNTATAQSPQYYKLGEVGAVEGYSLDAEQSNPSGGDTALTNYYYKADDPASPIEYVYISAASGAYDQIVSTVYANVRSIIPDAEMGEVAKGQVNDADYACFDYTYSETVEPETTAEPDATTAPDATAPEATTAPDAAAPEATATTTYSRSFNMYLKAIKDRSIAVHLTAQADTKEGLPSAEDLKAIAEQFAGNLTLVK